LIAADAVGAIVQHYVRLLSRERADRTDQCPRCASRNIRTFFDIAIEPEHFGGAVRRLEILD
jgi:hypothetical protein